MIERATGAGAQRRFIARAARIDADLGPDADADAAGEEAPGGERAARGVADGRGAAGR